VIMSTENTFIPIRCRNLSYLKGGRLDKSQFEKYKAERYEAEIECYSEKSRLNKRMYYFLQSAIIVLAAVTPILAVLSLRWPTTISSALIAIAAGLVKFMKFEENWVNYRTICETLKKEIHLMEAGLSDYAEAADRQQLFVERVESLISREHTLWLQTTSQKRDNK
jgi:hypothetical protein